MRSAASTADKLNFGRPLPTGEMTAGQISGNGERYNHHLNRKTPMKEQTTSRATLLQCAFIIGLALLACNWTARAQTPLVSVPFEDGLNNYTTNFFTSEQPVSSWVQWGGINGGSALAPANNRSGGSTAIYTNQTFDFSTRGRQYIMTLYCLFKPSPPPNSGSNRPLIHLGLVNRTNSVFTGTTAGGFPNRTVGLAYWWYSWKSATSYPVIAGDNYDLHAVCHTDGTLERELCVYDKPLQNNYPTYTWGKLTAIFANLGNNAIKVDGWVDGFTPDLSGSLRYHTAQSCVFTNIDIATNAAVYFAWRSRTNSGPLTVVDNFEVSEAPVPAAPTGLAATLGNGFIRLNWNYSLYGLAHNVYRSTSSTGPWGSPIASLYVTNTPPNPWVSNSVYTTYTDTGLVPGQTYYYVVTATNLAGESAFTSESTNTFQLAPASVVATGGTNQISLAWTALSGATNYVIQRSTVSGSGYASVGETTSTSFVDTGLLAGTRYYYILTAALDSGFPSGNSSEATAVTAPNTPASLVVEPFGSGALRFGWATGDTAPGTTIVEYSSNGSTFTPLKFITNCTATSTGYGGWYYSYDGRIYAYNSGLSAGTTEYFRAYTTNSAGWSSRSATVSATVPLAISVNFSDTFFTNVAGPLWPMPGYMDDYGFAFGLRGNGWSYGWDMDKTGSARTRGFYAMDDRYRTLNQMFRTNSWSINVPNGLYRAHVALGDPSSTASSGVRVQGLETMTIHPDGNLWPWWVDSWMTVAVTDGTLSVSNSVFFSTQAINDSNNRLLFLDLYPTAPAPNTIGSQPQSQSVIQHAKAEFSVWVSGGPEPYGYQWYKNNTPIPEANSRTLTFADVASADAGSYYVAVTNAGASVNSSVAVLTVTTRTAPVLLSAGSIDGATIGLAFDETLGAGAADYTLYTVNGGAVNVANAQVRYDGKTVKLWLDSPVTGSFTVAVANIPDAYGNTLTSGSVSGSVMGLTSEDIGVTPSGWTFTADNNTIEIAGGGGDIWGIEDGCRFVYQPISGDFDARVRVTALSFDYNPIAKAVLMARETTDPGSPDFVVDVNAPVALTNQFSNHGRDRFASDFRSGQSSNYTTIGTYYSPAGIPDCWMRLVRLGSEFKVYGSRDGGANWMLTCVTNITLNNNLLVGLGVTPHYADIGAFSTASFSGFTYTAPAADVTLSKTVSSPIATVGGTVQYTLTVKNQGAAAASAVTVTDPLPAGMTYVGSLTGSGTASESAGTVTWNVGSLSMDQTATLTINATVTTAGTKVNTATVTSSADSNLANNASTATLCMAAVPQVQNLAYNAGTGVFSFNLPTDAGVKYTVQYSDSLSPVSWNTLQMFVGNGNPQAIQDPGPSVSHRFYRVLAIAPY